MTVEQRSLGRPQTRADKVRARRARQFRKVEPLARAPKPKRSRRLRRRYDLAIPSELGAEVRLPAIPMLSIGARWLSLLLLGLTLWGIYRLYSDPAFRTAPASVEGASLLSPAQIRSIAQVEDAPAVLLDPHAAEQRLLAHPEISAARVSVGWPNQVRVEVVERLPMVEWNDGGRVWWLSADGIAFLTREDRPGLVRVFSPTPVLNIREDPLEAVLAPEILLAASVLSAQLPEDAELTYDPDHGLGFEDRRGWTANFGVSGDMVMKLRLYQAIAQELEDRNVAASVVSVENPSAPFYVDKR